MTNATTLHPKVAAGTLAAWVAGIGEWVYTTVSHNSIPNSVAVSIVGVLTFLASYLVPDGTSDGNDVDLTETNA